MVPTSNDDDDPEMQAMKHYMLRRRRRYWILMAFAAGIPLVVVGVWLAGFLIRPPTQLQLIVSPLPLLAWETHCANNILKTIPGLSDNARMLGLVPLLVVLAALNCAIVFGIFWAGCFLL